MNSWKSKNKLRIAFALTTLFISTMALGQIPVPPEGKYNTTNYPEDRKAIEALDGIRDNSKYNNDDYVSVGAEGRVYYGTAEEQKYFKDTGLRFKSRTAVKGTELLRVYNGNAAVYSVVYDVVFSSPRGDLYVQVIRSTTYVKEAGKWYVVFGQGTLVKSNENLEEAMEKARKKP